MAKAVLEAFREIENLYESQDSDFSLTSGDFDTLEGLLADDYESEPTIYDIIDLDAENEDEIEDSYVGKVILECNVCHTPIFKNKDEVFIDEDGIANISEECGVCSSNEGYTVVGEVKPYVEGEEEPEDELDIDSEDFEDDSLEDDDLEDDLEDEPMEESFKRNKKSLKEGRANNKLVDDLYRDLMQESCNESCEDGNCEDIDEECCNESFERKDVKESIENASIETEDEIMNMSSDDDGWHVDVSKKSADDFTDEDFSEDEMIAPLSDETEDEIEDNISEDEMDNEPEDELEDEVPEDADYEDIDFDDFDDESFDELGESYLRQCYGNVKSFKTTNVSQHGNKLVVEGMISFKSGKKKPTQFIFESYTASPNGRLSFLGTNKQITKGKDKTFRLNCSLKESKLIPDNMKFNYRVKRLNESVKVKGTAVKK